MRIYQVTQYTPREIGYRLVPYNGMQMQYAMDDQSVSVVAGKSKATLPSAPAGRRQIIEFLGFAPSIEVWNEQVAEAERVVREAQAQRRRDRITEFTSLGLSEEHATIVAENVYLRRQGKRHYYYALNWGCDWSHTSARPTDWHDRYDGVEGKGLPLYRLSSWLKFWGYDGTIRDGVDRFLHRNKFDY